MEQELNIFCIVKTKTTAGNSTYPPRWRGFAIRALTIEEGLVFRAEDYIYSSAIDYAGEKGMLDIFVIE